MLYQNAASSQVLVLVAASVLAATQWARIDHTIVLAWFLSITAITLARILGTLAYRRDSRRSQDARMWCRMFLVGATLSGIAWGCAGIWLLPLSEFGPQVIVILMLAGIVAAGVPFLSAVPDAVYLFSLPALAPMAIRFLLQPGDIYFTLGVITLIYFVAMVSIGRRINAQLMTSLELRHENSGLVEHLTDAKQKAESINTELVAEIGERKRVERNLAASLSLVQATLESTADGILVVDSFGRIVSFNQKFLTMWRMPERVAASGHDKALLAQVVEQLKDPEAFMARVRQVYATPALESFDLLEFKDGRVFERFSMPQRIGGQIVGRVWSFRDVTDRRKAEMDLHFAANHDHLTGLPNRAAFADRLHTAVLRARRHSRQLAVVFIDLDRFKTINETLGHTAGDRLLTVVAARLSASLREIDCVARLGGDEFVLLLEDLAAEKPLGRIAQKILETLAQPYDIDGHECHVTASIGISTFPGDGDDAQTLLKNADVAMYRAKEQGKNAFEFYSSELNLRTVERLALEASLRRAVHRGEFALHYQPKIDLAGDRVIGVEALVRWRHPELGNIPPNTFIPIAEETGLIGRISEWVLRTACLQAAEWRQQALPRLRMAVNVSARQFAQGGLTEQVKAVLEETGLEPDLLELELTESMVMHNTDRAIKIMAELRGLGAHLSIDDFGTGYSSLGYLKRFPIDSVKIDRSFVRDVPASPDDAALSKAIIDMAHTLRLRAVAEGVETAAQVEFLRRHGCDEVQGYYFGKPMPAAELEEFVKRHHSEPPAAVPRAATR